MPQTTTTNLREINAFGVRINPLTINDFTAIIERGIKDNIQIVQSGVNASSIVEIKQNLDLLKAYINCDLVNIDGMSLVWALRFFGYKVPSRVACPDLAEEVLKIAELNNYKIFMLGTGKEQLQSAVHNIQIKYPKLEISGYRDGFFKEEEEPGIVELINQAKPNILFLGLPSPKKEFFVEKFKNQLHVNYVLGVGGFFDILAGTIKRAPVWMQKIGLEWFYRFMQEPKRLFRRYFIGNFIFLGLVIREKMRTYRKLK